MVPKVDKTKKRSFSAPEEPLPIYNVGKRVGPPPRKVREVDGKTILKEFTKKNLLFILARLHYAAHQQKVSSWTGFNIMVHDKDAIIPNNVLMFPPSTRPSTDHSLSCARSISQASYVFSIRPSMPRRLR